VILQLLDIPRVRHWLYDDSGGNVEAGNNVLYGAIEC
jgi:hypothetical protein